MLIVNFCGANFVKPMTGRKWGKNRGKDGILCSFNIYKKKPSNFVKEFVTHSLKWFKLLIVNCCTAGILK